MNAPWRAAGSRSDLHEVRSAAWLGMGLALTFGTCFLTGVWSHLAQEPPSWFTYPARPAGLYRVTQGLHVASGTAAIPLLLAKLWVVHPRLFDWPPARSVLHAVERLALLPLVGGALFEVLSGTLNVARWYPWSFFFPRAHFWVAWITVGALCVHVGAKAAAARDALRHQPRAAGAALASPDDRRAFLGGIGAISLGLVAATAGGTVSALGSVSARWRGVPLRDLLVRAGREPGDAEATVVSLQPGGRYRASDLNADQAADPDTLLALELDGEPLHIDHGFPVRLIGPNRPGVLQTKWVSKLVVR